MPSAALNVVVMGNRPVAALWRIKDQRLVDLSHLIVDGMITFRGLPAPTHLRSLGSRESVGSIYADGSSFQIGHIDMVANTGTYLDTPFHRYDAGPDLAGLRFGQTGTLPGVVVRGRGRGGVDGRQASSGGWTSRAMPCSSTPAGIGIGARTPISFEGIPS